MMPPLNLKASVVVPWAILIGQLGLLWSSVIARSHDAEEATGGSAKLRESGGVASARACCWFSWA